MEGWHSLKVSIVVQLHVRQPMIKNYLLWCWKCKEILPWCVSLVSNEELTQEEYEYPALVAEMV